MAMSLTGDALGGLRERRSIDTNVHLLATGCIGVHSAQSGLSCEGLQAAPTDTHSLMIGQQTCFAGQALLSEGRRRPHQEVLVRGSGRLVRSILVQGGALHANRV